MSIMPFSILLLTQVHLSLLKLVAVRLLQQQDKSTPSSVLSLELKISTLPQPIGGLKAILMSLRHKLEPTLTLSPSLLSGYQMLESTHVLLLLPLTTLPEM